MLTVRVDDEAEIANVAWQPTFGLGPKTQQREFHSSDDAFRHRYNWAITPQAPQSTNAARRERLVQ